MKLLDDRVFVSVNLPAVLKTTKKVLYFSLFTLLLILLVSLVLHLFDSWLALVVFYFYTGITLNLKPFIGKFMFFKPFPKWDGPSSKSLTAVEIIGVTIVCVCIWGIEIPLLCIKKLDNLIERKVL